MPSRRKALPLLATFLVCLLWTPLLRAADLETVLSNMDKAAADFHTLKADVEWVKYTALVDVKSIEEGVIYVRRNKDGSVDMLTEFQKPYPYFFSVRGTKAQIYRPKIATVEEYDLSRSKETLDQALLLGFGTSGSFLKENYDITLQGEEEAAGEDTVKLELVPKSEDLKKKIPRLEMWISTESWQPVQEKLYENLKSGDYRLYTYTNIESNPTLKDSHFRLKLPGNVKKISPQK